MANEKIPLCEQELLYDPMFAKNPNEILKDNPEKGIFGKVALKKAIFIIVLIFFISLSMYFSFRTVSKDVYTFEENGTFSDGSPAFMLSEYHSDSKRVLVIDFVRDESDVPDETKPIKEVQKFAVNCNESLTFIYISDTVDTIDPKAFYTCKNLKAIFVDENNPNYMSIDGVLYRKENGVPVEIMMFPNKNPEYRAALSLGLEAPTDHRTYGSFFLHYEALEKEQPTETDSDNGERNRLNAATYETYSAFTIPETVTLINQLCFANTESLRFITFNDNITEIGNLAFFKCKNIEEINIPDSVITIGTDAFSGCEKITDIFIPASVKTIGHHAFYDCKNVSVVRMECSEEEAKEMELGSAWLPEKRKVIMRPIGVSYNEEREVK
ncbi:MAG: leucine-rich repeat domain-containing protein [Clostridia bacterium]|nr:leucine-rich repeat domain-containing protein [Clostridia bacterium]